MKLEQPARERKSKEPKMSTGKFGERGEIQSCVQKKRIGEIVKRELELVGGRGLF
jgi:hypothetical protein